MIELHYQLIMQLIHVMVMYILMAIIGGSERWAIKIPKQLVYVGKVIAEPLERLIISGVISSVLE